MKSCGALLDGSLEQDDTAGSIGFRKFRNCSFVAFAESDNLLSLNSYRASKQLLAHSHAHAKVELVRNTFMRTPSDYKILWLAMTFGFSISIHVRGF